ncbi:MAG: hypothetical protein GY854_01820 [Deltaproteobacteria bacterium]|nr:hypothetical protein [Deltaproteobacteria bacterium]
MTDPKPEEKVEAPSGDERKVPESALKKQAADFAAERESMNAQLTELAAFREKFDNDAKKADEDKLKREGEHEKIIAERDTSIAELKNSIAGLERSNVVSDARDALRNAGMTDALRIKGALGDLPADIKKDGVAEWLTTFKAANASAFEAVANPTAQPRAGAPAPLDGSVNWEAVKAWEKGDDKEKRKDARKLLAAHREKHGKYPY